MQKKIIALAIAGLASSGAFAQSNVTVSGNIGASYNQYTLSGATAARTTYKQNMVSDESSAIILKGEEALGNGLTAWFQIDSRLTMDRGNGATNNYNQPYTASGLGNGNTAIGLKGNFGTVGIGRWDIHYDTFSAIGEVVTAGALAARIGYFGVMAQVNGAQVALGTRAANVMFYDTPTFNGFKGRIGYSTAAAGGEGEGFLAAANGDPGSGSAYQVKLNYDNGPIAVVYSYFNHKVEDRGNYTACATASTGLALTCPPTATAAGAINPTDQKSSRLGASYTFPMGLRVGLGWDRSTMTSNVAALGDRTRTAWMLPVSYTMGNHTFHGTYAKAGNTSGVAANANGSTDTSAKEWMLAYGYNFTKRTSMGVQYITLRTGDNAASTLAGASAGNTGLTANAVGEDAKLWSFNVRHFF
jgi:predicted porin